MNNKPTVDPISERMRSLFKVQLETTLPETGGRRAGQKKLFYIAKKKELKREGFDGSILVAVESIYDTELDALCMYAFERMHDNIPVFNVDCLTLID